MIKVKLDGWPYSLPEAVRLVCDGSDYDRGQTETLEAGIIKTQDLIASILEQLPATTIARILEKVTYRTIEVKEEL